MKLKICGMRDKSNIEAVASMGVDFMGFIFYAKSPRFVGNEFKIPSLPPSVEKVGVFVNETTEEMRRVSQKYELNYLQLHGNETVDQCEELRNENLKVIKVFSVDSDFDFAQTTPYQEVVNYFMFDTKGKHFGGNAFAFDWEILKAYNQKIPFFLSGGLNPSNIKDIENLSGMNLYALDVNSGVESAPALKDISKIKALKEQLKKLDKNQQRI